MILYSIQWQASHGNWSCYANKPASFEGHVAALTRCSVIGQLVFTKLLIFNSVINNVIQYTMDHSLIW
jgi:hypothetical protein